MSETEPGASLTPLDDDSIGNDPTATQDAGALTARSAADDTVRAVDDADLHDDDDVDGDEADGEEQSGSPSRASLLVREGDIAADYLERLLDIVDYDGDIDLDVENDRAVVAVVGGNLRGLVGAHGETLEALQELTRLAVQQQTGVRSRLMLDVSGHRQARRTQLQKLAADTAAQVLHGGEAVRLAPMNPFERKVVHDAVATLAGVSSESEGEEPNRRVVVLTAR